MVALFDIRYQPVFLNHLCNQENMWNLRLKSQKRGCAIKNMQNEMIITRMNHNPKLKSRSIYTYFVLPKPLNSAIFAGGTSLLITHHSKLGTLPSSGVRPILPALRWGTSLSGRAFAVLQLQDEARIQKV